jgi:hypothetical protein
VNPCTKEESNDGCSEAPVRCVEARIRCLHPVGVVGLVAAELRRWTLHGGGSSWCGVVCLLGFSINVGSHWRFRCIHLCGCVEELQRCSILFVIFVYRVGVVLMSQSNRSACGTRVDRPIQPGEYNELIGSLFFRYGTCPATR